MLNPIIFLSALYDTNIDNYVEKIDKCSVFWVVNKIEIKQNNECVDSLLITIDWENNYLINSTKLTNIDCEIDWYYKFYNDNNLFKNWDTVNLLIDKNTNTIISDSLNEDWFFTLISGNSLNEEIWICKDYYSSSNYFLSIFIIFIFFIIFLYFLKKIKLFNNKKLCAKLNEKS